MTILRGEGGVDVDVEKVRLRSLPPTTPSGLDGLEVGVQETVQGPVVLEADRTDVREGVVGGAISALRGPPAARTPKVSVYGVDLVLPPQPRILPCQFLWFRHRSLSTRV